MFKFVDVLAKWLEAQEKNSLESEYYNELGTRIFLYILLS